MLIAEELLLLALDNQSGKPLVGSDRLEPALGGALIAELALMERIGVTPHSEGWRKRGRVTITNLTPTDDPELDAALHRLAEREGKKVKDFLSELSTKKVRVTYKLRERLLDRLARSGAVTRQEGTVLGFIPRTTWPAASTLGRGRRTRQAARSPGRRHHADRANRRPWSPCSRSAGW